MTRKTSRAFVGTAMGVLLIMSMAFLLQGCGQVSTGVSGSDFPFTVTDDLGRQVTVTQAPDRKSVV